ncbi:MAG TPA: trypsin-like peptidase domain-containing protein, partial [Anaerolineae bacterium]|nr:trypsin-like peptidase domain-containing protein [Anaerolineae bacterium]
MKTFFRSSICSGILLTVFFSLVISTYPCFAELPVVKSEDRIESPFAKVYEKVAPSVIRIDIRGKIESRSSQIDPRDYFYNAPRRQTEQRPYTGMGSGVIIDREGHIITNNHDKQSPDKNVADKIEVTLNDNESYDAEVVGRDPESDLAIIKLKLEGKKLPEEYVAELGDSDTLRPGDYAIAIGNPIGLERTITVGVISALGRYNLQPFGTDIKFENSIQTDAQINPGNSGGALADINGKVIGINNMYAGEFAGIGFAIPINLAKNVINQIIATGEVKRGFVGIEGGDISQEFQEELGLSSREGVFIKEVLTNSPAEKAGLENRDIIISLGGEKIKNFNDFLLKIADMTPGSIVLFDVIHKGNRKTVSLELTDRTIFEATMTESAANWRGIHVIDIASAQNFNLGDIDSGVVVSKIDPGSPASDTFLAEGDVIIQINLTDNIKNVNDFRNVIEKYKDSKKPLLIYRMHRFSNGRISKGYVPVKN